MVDALLVVFRNFRPRIERIPRFTDSDLQSLSMPVQVIVGSNDGMLDSGETCERVERHVRNASITCIGNAGHILPPQTAAVAAFLNRVRSVENVA
jgi:pimeloyl-ACP methyl ester carboxylesterase